VDHPVAASDGARARERDRDVDVFDVGAEARQMAAGFKRGKPHKQIYYQGPGGTAHLHLIMPGQTIPLHIHERSEEATVPVMRRPVVTQRFASGGAIETKKAQYDEGTLIVSPRNCAHEWVNPFPDQFHASLVFTLGQTFTGNLFVSPDDVRIGTSAPAVILDPFAPFEEFSKSSERQRRIDVPVAQGSLAAVFVKDSYSVEPLAGDVALVYVVRGNARVVGTPSPIRVVPGVLVVLRHAPGARVVADTEGPVAFYLVGIPRRAAQAEGGPR